MNELYQDANNCSPFDVKFGGGKIKVSTDDTVIPAGWEVTINQQYQQVIVIITGKQGLKYGSVPLTVSLHGGTSENSVFQWIFQHSGS